MCKRHWNEINKPKKTKQDKKKVDPQGKSVYDDIIPRSFMWKNGAMSGKMIKIETSESADDTDTYAYEFTTTMPLAKLLKDNASSEAGWHRRAECLARGIKPPDSLKCKLEEWEAQIAIIEMALLVGIESHHSSSDDKYQGLLAYAWGRNMKDFRRHLVSRICSRRGNLSRKKKRDANHAMLGEKRTIDEVNANATEVEQVKRKKLDEASKEIEENKGGSTEMMNSKILTECFGEVEDILPGNDGAADLSEDKEE